MKNKTFKLFATLLVVLALVSFAPAHVSKVEGANAGNNGKDVGNSRNDNSGNGNADGDSNNGNGSKKQKLLNQPADPNVFGYAWSSNIGWIRMNSCDDTNADGKITGADVCSSPTFGVKIGDGTVLGGAGSLSGYAWNDNIGWIVFGDPDVGSSPTGGSSGASMTLNGSTGTFSGWGKALNAGSNEWLSLAGANYPSGVDTTGKTGGVTYNKTKGTIVGYAWGGDIIGWVHFGGKNPDNSDSIEKVTYGVPVTVPFDFVLTASPTTYTTPATPPVNATYNASNIHVAFSGDAVNYQPVSLSTSVTGPDANTPNFVVSLASPCASTCDKTLTVTTKTTTKPGIYNIIVIAKASGEADQQTTVTVTVPSNFAAVCSSAVSVPATPPYYVNIPIKRNLNISKGTPISSGGATPTYSYNLALSGTNITGGDSMTTVSAPDVTGVASYSLTKTYSTTGVKAVTINITDNNSSNPVVCPSITVLAKPDTGEF